MNKKIMIRLGIATVCIVGLVGSVYLINSNRGKNQSYNKLVVDGELKSGEESGEQSKKSEGDKLEGEEVNEDKVIVQEEPKEVLGVNYNELKDRLVPNGYKAINESTYEYWEGEVCMGSIVVDEIMIIISIQDKSDEFKEATKTVFKSIVPNGYEELYNIVFGEVEPQTLSLDNRTISVESDTNEIKIYINN